MKGHDCNFCFHICICNLWLTHKAATKYHCHNSREYIHIQETFWEKLRGQVQSVAPFNPSLPSHCLGKLPAAHFSHFLSSQINKCLSRTSLDFMSQSSHFFLYLSSMSLCPPLGGSSDVVAVSVILCSF